MTLPDKQTLEREIKLTVPRNFVLPKLSGEPLPPRTLTATYFDTENYQLALANITLRHRIEAGKGVWQLKLPRERARLELEFSGDRRQPPELLLKLLFAHLRKQPLKPIARLRTRRTGIRVGGLKNPIADVVLDSVVALEGRRVTCHLYELEVELIRGNEIALRRLEKTLREAGAQDGDPRAKVFQVLKLQLPVSMSPPPSAPPIDHLRVLLQTQLHLILAHDPGTRLGSEPEELHRMRVATRRFRAYLKTARSILVPDWVEHVSAEVAWLGRTLGPVRDLDVLLGHLHKECDSLRLPERRAFEGLADRLQQQRLAAHATLLQALESDRYLAMLERLETGIQSPAMGEGCDSLTDIAGAAFKKLRRIIKVNGLDASDTTLHQIRIKGKKARYAAELAQTSVGKPAVRFFVKPKSFKTCLESITMRR